MKEKMKTRRLKNKNEVWYEWIIVNMTDTDTADGDTRTNGIWNSLNNQFTQTHAGTITWRVEVRSLEETMTKDPKRLKTRTVDQSIKLKH